MSKETNIPKEVLDKLTEYNNELIKLAANITQEELLKCLSMVSMTAFKEGVLYGITEVRNMINWEGVKK
tara:strand:+ start:743 stop:949 length:207 start_codon:yes stop_codon:yes gene_type:complete